MEKPLYKHHADEAKKELEKTNNMRSENMYNLALTHLEFAQANALVSIALSMSVMIQKLDVIIARQMGKLGK